MSGALSHDRLLKAEALLKDARILFASVGRPVASATSLLDVPEAEREAALPAREERLARAIGYIDVARDLLKDAQEDMRAMVLALYIGAVDGEHTEA